MEIKLMKMKLIIDGFPLWNVSISWGCNYTSWSIISPRFKWREYVVAIHCTSRHCDTVTSCWITLMGLHEEIMRCCQMTRFVLLKIMATKYESKNIIKKTKPTSDPLRRERDLICVYFWTSLPCEVFLKVTVARKGCKRRTDRVEVPPFSDFVRAELWFYHEYQASEKKKLSIILKFTISRFK